MSFEKLLITLFTVFVGWSLNELSQFFRYKKKDKKTVNQTIYYLIDLKFILSQVNDIIEAAKKQEKLNSISKRSYNNLIKDERFSSSFFRSKLKESVSLISTIDPILAQELRVSVDGAQVFDEAFLKFKDGSLDDKEFLDFRFQGINVFVKNIDRFIKKLAFRKSKITWLKIHWENFKRSKQSDKLWSKHFTELNNIDTAT